MLTDGQRGTFLVDIGAKINKQRDSNGKHVLSVVEDKVVQDIDGTEGTGVRPLQTVIDIPYTLIPSHRSGHL